MDFDKGKFSALTAAVILIVLICLGVVWYTNPELITYWFKKEQLIGEVYWQPGPPPAVFVRNNSDGEWKDVKITLNKTSVSQRYDCSFPSLPKGPRGTTISATMFKKSNGEAYDVNLGNPQLLTVEATLPDGKAAKLEIPIGDKKISN